MELSHLMIGEGRGSRYRERGGGEGVDNVISLISRGREGRGGGEREREAGEGIGDDIVFAGSVTDVGGELGDVGKLALLTCVPGRGDAVKGGNEMLVVGEDVETAAFKEKAEVANGGEDSEELHVEGGCEFMAEEGKGPMRASVRGLRIPVA